MADTDTLLSSAPIPAPVESAVARAARDELRRVLDPPLTVASLRRVGRIVTASIKMLKATAEGVAAHEDRPKPKPSPYGFGNYSGGLSADPDEVDVGDEGTSAPTGLGLSAYAPSSPVETFGTGTFREIAALAMKFLNKPKERDPEELVQALAAAKEAGLGPEVIEPLREALARTLRPGTPQPPPPILAPQAVAVTVPDPLSPSGPDATMLVGPY